MIIFHLIFLSFFPINGQKITATFLWRGKSRIKLLTYIFSTWPNNFLLTFYTFFNTGHNLYTIQNLVLWSRVSCMLNCLYSSLKEHTSFYIGNVEMGKIYGHLMDIRLTKLGMGTKKKQTFKWMLKSTLFFLAVRLWLQKKIKTMLQIATLIH